MQSPRDRLKSFRRILKVKFSSIILPSLAGFSDNPFKTREDVKTAAMTLLTALKPHISPGGARIRLASSTGAHFDEIAAQIEGYARPLWVVGILLGTDDTSNQLLTSWIKGLVAGTDPSHPEYWGDVGDKDQRMVEMEIIAFALLSAPGKLLPDISPDSGLDAATLAKNTEKRNNIVVWLWSINHKVMPDTNWLWFRVITNLALVKACGVPLSELRESMNADLELLDRFYMGDGWASDGFWNDDGRQADYYSGSFAIQYSQLLYTIHASDIDPERADTYRQRAKQFAEGFGHYFDTAGASIPFGRSLTYRFTMVAFWSMAALAKVELPEEWSQGAIKGVILRHLRWWAAKNGIFHPDGTLNIGFCYPNMYMCEDYNSPQSPYWCMKAFCMLGLSATDDFWTCEELPHPLFSSVDSMNTAITSVKVVEHPKQIVCKSQYHHFLLSSGQFCGWPLKSTEAKYSKFAYSSHFGFSVPTGPLIQQMAPDSTLALSNDGGETWRVRWRTQNARVVSVDLYSEGTPTPLPALVGDWRPWKNSDVLVEATLISLSNYWPDWHLRVHRISTGSECKSPLTLVDISATEGGFAIYGRAADGMALPSFQKSEGIEPSKRKSTPSEGTLEAADSSFVKSSEGAVGIVALNTDHALGQVLKPDSNTNLIWQRTLIPTIKHQMLKQVESSKSNQAVLVTAVFAVSGDDVPMQEIWKRWNNRPRVLTGHSGGNDTYIVV